MRVKPPRNPGRFSDLHAYNAEPGYEGMCVPVVLGHEFSGTVAALGPGTERFAVGDRVVAIGIQGCGRCAACATGNTHLCRGRAVIGLHRDGGMAEHVIVDGAHLVAVPPGVDLAVATLAEPLSVAVHAVRGRSRIRRGDLVVVSGPGPIGLLCGFLARLAGARVVAIGTTSDAAVRLPAAAALGMETIDLGRATVASALDAEPDAWVEASGSVAALDAALGTVRWGGRVTVVALYAHALEFFPTPAVRRELELFFSYGSTVDDYRVALDVLERHGEALGRLTTPFDLDDADEAFRRALAGSVVKPMLTIRGGHE